MIHSYLATCPEEIQSILEEELETLGAENIQSGYKAVKFQANLETAYKIHLECATASRILRILREGNVRVLKQLDTHPRKIDWSKVLPAKTKYVVKATVGDRNVHNMTTGNISHAIKAAITENFPRGSEPQPDAKNAQVTIVGFLAHGKFTIAVDTSGKALHKRGYRHTDHEAPIKETLAHAILKMAGYKGDEPLLDPMCGSGTIPIEASFIALRKSPLIHRKKGEFGFEHLEDFDNSIWRKVQDDVRNQRDAEPKYPIYASDIQGSHVKAAQNTALKARVEKHITFTTKSFFDYEPTEDHGLVIANLPYDERLKLQTDTTQFYKDVGDTLKKRFSGWRAALLVAEESPYKFIGLKPSKKFSVLNGSIPCKLLIFHMFKGNLATHKTLAKGLKNND
ncbi:MAG: class I SAM-dependent RNA methyltransferase [Oligoflexales bacterium]